MQSHTLIDLEHAHADTLHALHVYLGTMYTILMIVHGGICDTHAEFR